MLNVKWLFTLGLISVSGLSQASDFTVQRNLQAGMSFDLLKEQQAQLEVYLSSDSTIDAQQDISLGPFPKTTSTQTFTLPANLSESGKYYLGWQDSEGKHGIFEAVFVQANQSPVPFILRNNLTADVQVGKPVIFNAAASYDVDGLIKQYNWSSKQGLFSSKQEATYTFQQVGKQSISLTVFDDAGLQSTQTVYIDVKPAETAQIAAVPQKRLK